MEKPTVFISYSHKDAVWMKRLETHLKVLQYEKHFDLWVDEQIKGGDEWFHKIKEAIQKTNIAILMISANSLTSEFILHEEVPAFLEKRKLEGLRIYPVIVKDCAWRRIKWLSQFNVRPKDGEPLSEGNKNDQEKKLSAIAEEIDDLVHFVPADDNIVYSLPPSKISLAKLPSTTANLFGRDNELKTLDDAWNKTNIHILNLVAFGGVGKTALVNTWLQTMREAHFRGAEYVYGWSFYSQGTSEDRQVSADAFIAETLAWFGDPHPDSGSPWQKGERLADYIKKKKTILILDGLEPLQYPHQQGKIKDPGLQSLLGELAYKNPGLCIITTRFAINDLHGFSNSTAPHIQLEKLSPNAGSQLLQSLKVTGTEEELRKATDEFGGHALALTLLGNYLTSAYNGDIRERNKIPAIMEEESKGGHAKRVMRSYEKMFEGKPELDILHILGLFDRPAHQSAINAITKEPIIAGLTNQLHDLPETKWNLALNHLRAAGLLNKDEHNNHSALDCHPLIREYFGEQLKQNNPDAWKEAHSRLYEYYKTVPKKEFPDIIEEMEPLYAAVMHGCKAQRYQEALNDVYLKRIARGNENYSIHKLGAFGADLTAISGFFEKIWVQPAPDLREPEKSFLLNKVGFCLRALGRLQEASHLMQKSLDICIKQKKWKNAAQVSGNLSELFLTLGDLSQAFDYAKRNVQYADISNLLFWKMVSKTIISNTMHQAGLLKESETSFRDAEVMQKEDDSKFDILYSLRGYQYCDLLFSQGKSIEVKRRAEQILEWARIINTDLLIIALGTLSLGQSEVIQALKEIKCCFQKAVEILNQAVEDLRKTGMQDNLPLGLFARAEVYRITENFEHAHRDLHEAMTIATRGEMRLHEADCHLQYSRLYLAEGDKEKSREHLEKAETMINEMGYHRRDPEVQVDYARLLLAEGKKDQARPYLGNAKKLVDEMGYHCLDRDVRELEGLLK